VRPDATLPIPAWQYMPLPAGFLDELDFLLASLGCSLLLGLFHVLVQLIELLVHLLGIIQGLARLLHLEDNILDVLFLLMSGRQ
jgi:hypothetical protein